MSGTHDLEQYRRWLYGFAHSILWANSAARRVLTVDDLAQEGWIAMWRAQQTYDPSRSEERAHLTNAARVRMIDIVSSKKPSFGTEGNRQRTKVPETLYAPLPEPDSDEELVAEAMLEEAADGRLAQALDAMSPAAREYVERVFWGNERLRRDRAAWREAEAVIREYLSEAA